jgi:hypothetical protein
MAAEVKTFLSLDLTSYWASCKECTWDSFDYGIREAAETATADHNAAEHPTAVSLPRPAKTSKTVYDPFRHSEASRLRFANAALINAALQFSADPESVDALEQLQVEANIVTELRKAEPVWETSENWS